MAWRSWLGGTAIVAYVGILAHVTGATMCPAREEGGCAKVHALMRGRPAAARVVTIAEPMTSRSADAPAQIVLAQR
jgi:hypothetical protein